MLQGTSTFLNWMRVAAATAVLVVHAMILVPGTTIDSVVHLGSEAVSVFFVLSGFVIGYVTTANERDAATYAINRLARIYSVAVPAAGVTLVADLIGRSCLPASDPLFWGHMGFGQISRMMAGLLFVNEIWDRHIVPGSNQPWWSLGMEVPYYVAFGIAFFARGRWKWLTLLFLAAFPKAFVMAAMWVSGFLAFRLPPPRAASVKPMLWSAAVGYVVFELARWHFAWGDGGEPLYLVNWRSRPFFAVAGIFAVAAYASRGLTFVPGRTTAHWLSGRTFTLYLVHYPILQLSASAMPAGSGPVLQFGLAIILAIAATFALAEIGETRKRAWRRVFELISDRAGSAVRRIPVEHPYGGT